MATTVRQTPASNAQQPVLGNGVPAATNPPGTQGFQQGDTLVFEQSGLTFAIVEWQSKGLNEKNLEVFMIKVEFEGGRQETFECGSKSLATALTKVEVFGQQFKQHSNDDAAYEKFYKSKVGKTVWIHSDKFGEKGNRSVRITSLQEKSTGDVLEYAFGGTSVIVIDEEMRREIKKLAKYHLTAPDDPATVNNNDLVLRMNQV